MNKLMVLSLILGFVSFGCAHNQTAVATTDAKPAQSGAGANAVTEAKNEPSVTETEIKGDGAKFKKLVFSAKNLPKAAAFEGKILGGAKWLDNNGENVLIVSQKDSPAKENDANIQQIFGYLYATKNGETKQLWKIQDSNENPCDSGRGLVSPVEAADIDGDGVAENMFVYNVVGNCDVSPATYKLMMHSGEKKLAIRGTNGVDAPGMKIKGEKNFDSAFDSAPAAFRQTASQFWNKHVKPLGKE